MENSVLYNNPNDDEYFNNYKIYESIYINEGKIQKYVTGSGLFKNDENKLITNEKFIPIEECKLRDYKIRNIKREKNIQNSEIYDELIIKCKSNIRDKQEENIRENIKSEIKSSVIEKIYNKSYPKIKETLTKDYEAKINSEIYSLEINEFKNMYENLKEIKELNLTKLEEEFKSQIRDELKETFNNDVCRIEKRIKYEFVRKLQSLKMNLSNSIKSELENQKRSIVKEINDIGGKLYSESVTKNINKSHSVDKKQQSNSGNFHRGVNSNKLQIKKSNMKRSNSTSDFKGTEFKLNCNTRNLYLSKEINTATLDNIDKKIKDDNEKSSFSKSKEKSIEKLMSNDHNIKILSSSVKEPSIKDFKKNNTISIEEKISQVKAKVCNISKPIDNYKVDNNKIFLSPEKINIINHETNLLCFHKNECVSLNIEESTPISMKAFSKFIPKYIEREESIKLFLENNSKKLKKSILSKFLKANKSDHCMLDFLFELWDNLDVSYQQRYKILISLENSDKIIEIYSRLDKETEILSRYYENSKEIFSYIKKRERKKSLLQAKINRSK